MTNAEAREEFNKMIEMETDGDTIAKLEVLREWFTSYKFRRVLEEWSWYHTAKNPQEAQNG